MIRFVFFDHDDIKFVCESEEPLTKAGKFIAPVQDLFNQVLRGELDRDVIIEKLPETP